MRSKSERPEVWKERVAEWKASGQTAAEWGASRGIKAHLLLNWSSRLNKQVRSTEGLPRFTEVKLPVVPDTLPVPHSSAVEIQSRQGVLLRFQTLPDLSTLAVVLAILEGTS